MNLLLFYSMGASVTGASVFFLIFWRCRLSLQHIGRRIIAPIQGAKKTYTRACPTAVSRIMRIFMGLVLTTAHLLSPLHAHEYVLKRLKVEHPHTPPTIAQQQTGVAYLTIINTGSEEDTLIEATTPVAQTTELHNMETVNNLMKMRSVSNIVIKPNASLIMKPGSNYHIMLFNLRRPLQLKERFPLTLKFKKSGVITVMVWVENMR